MLIITLLLTFGLAQQTQQMRQQVGQEQVLVDTLMELREIEARLAQLTDQLARDLGYPTAQNRGDLERRIAVLEQLAQASALVQARRDLHSLLLEIQTGQNTAEVIQEIRAIRTNILQAFAGAYGRTNVEQLLQLLDRLAELVPGESDQAIAVLHQAVDRIEQMLRNIQQEEVPWALQGDEAGRTVLEVGNRTITEREFNQRFNLAMRALAAQQGIPLNEQTRALFDQLRPEYLEQLATEQVLLQEAQRRGVGLTDQEVNTLLEQVRADFGNEEAFNRFLSDVGFNNEAAFGDYLREQETLQRVVQELGRDVQVTDERIQTFYDENQQRIGQPLENVRDQIRTVLQRQQVGERIDELREGADVQTYPENLGMQFQEDTSGEGTTGQGN